MPGMTKRVEPAEVREQVAELLPARDALSAFNLANITAINISLAINAGTIGSTALSDANLLLSGVQH